MAETLVLANFTIDSTGVVKAANVSNKAISSVNDTMARTQVVSRNTLSAIGRFTLGLGGVSAAALFLHRALVGSVNDAIAYDRKMKESGGVTTGLADRMDRLSRATGEASRGFGQFILNMPGVAAVTESATDALTAMGVALDEISSGRRLAAIAEAASKFRLGRPGMAVPPVIQGKFPAKPRAETTPSQDIIDRILGAVDFEKRFESLRRGLDTVNVSAEHFRVVTEGNTEAMDNFIHVGENLDSMIGPMKELNDAIAENQKAWFRSQEAIQQWKTLAAEGAAVGIESLSGVLLGTENLTRQWAANTLAAMVPVFLGYAAMGVVQGILGIEGGWAAAAKATIAAVAAAAASRALGGPGSNTSSGGFSGGGGGGRGGGLGVGGTRGASSIIINVQGSIIGTNPDSLARDLNRLIKTNQGDGAR